MTYSQHNAMDIGRHGIDAVNQPKFIVDNQNAFSYQSAKRCPFGFGAFQNRADHFCSTWSLAQK